MNGKEWTKYEVDYLKNNYSNNSTKDLSIKINRSISQIYNKAYSLKLKKSEAFLKSDKSGRLQKGDKTGNKTAFKKGNIPFNKGKKWSDYLPKEKQSKILKTTFQKGNKTHNTKEINTINLRYNKNKIPYYHIKISKSKWQMLHVYLWEQAYGKTEKNEIIVFKDKNTLNCKIENLEKITRIENMYRNSKHKYPKEIIPSMVLINELETKLKTL